MAATPLFDAANVPNIPPEIKELPRWVTWFEGVVGTKTDKPAKVPSCPQRPTVAANNQSPQTWRPFDVAVGAAGVHGVGIGVVFVAGEPEIGLDIDHCVDPPFGDLSEEALTTLKMLPLTYVEYSPSGTGVHALAYGTTGPACKTGRGELYSHGRYFTVTGRKVDWAPSTLAEWSPADIGRLREHLQAGEPGYTPRKGEEGEVYKADWQDVYIEEDDVAIPHGAMGVLWSEVDKFGATWSEKRRDLKSPSEYDMSLGRVARNLGWDEQQVYRLIRDWRSERGYPIKMVAIRCTLAKLRGEVKDDGVLQGVAQLDAETDRAVILEKLRTVFLGLPLTRIVCSGKDPEQYRVYFEGDHDGVLVGDQVMLFKHERWSAFVGRRVPNALLPHLPAKKWNGVKALLMKLVDYEEDTGSGQGDETRDWIEDYTGNVSEHQRATAMLLTTSGVFYDDFGALHIPLNAFLTYVHTVVRNPLTKKALQARLTAIGWHSVQVHRKDDKGKGITKRYWTLDNAAQVSDNSPVMQNDDASLDSGTVGGCDVKTP